MGRIDTRPSPESPATVFDRIASWCLSEEPDNPLSKRITRETRFEEIRVHRASRFKLFRSINPWPKSTLQIDHFFADEIKPLETAGRLSDCIAARIEEKKRRRRLEIDFEEALLTPYTGERLIEGIGDPNLRSRQQVDATLKWTPGGAKLDDFRLSPGAVSMAERLGYEIEDDLGLSGS